MEMDKLEDSPIRLIPKEELPSYGQEGFEVVTNKTAPPMEIKFLDYRYTRLFPISAQVDGALRFMSKDCIFEFKTMKSQQFQLLIEVPPEYKKQGAMYSLCTGLRYVLYLFINKDTQEFKAYLVEFDERAHEWVRSRLNTLEDYVEQGKLPPKEESQDCRYCPFKSLCENDVSSI